MIAFVEQVLAWGFIGCAATVVGATLYALVFVDADEYYGRNLKWDNGRPEVPDPLSHAMGLRDGD